MPLCLFLLLYFSEQCIHAETVQCRLYSLFQPLAHIEHEAHYGALELYGLRVGIPAAGICCALLKLRRRLSSRCRIDNLRLTDMRLVSIT